MGAGGWELAEYGATLTAQGGSLVVRQADGSTVRFPPSGPGPWAHPDERPTGGRC